MSRKIVIIGAPRSGTNMLRDVLTSMPGVATWPCDEINYIWRHGNVRYPSDEFAPDMARPEVSKYIRRQFDWVAKKYHAHTVVEKTCANSLRVGFVDKVVPEAKYIFIRRDGLDAVGSAIKRWKAELDIPYLARKARFVPLADFPYYAGRYFWNRVHKVISKEARLSFWGPKLNDMNDILANHSLEEVCAIQWQRCVDNAARDLDCISDKRWVELDYERFVKDPVKELTQILAFLNIHHTEEQVWQAVSGISDRSVGKGRNSLEQHTALQLEKLIGETLERYNYKPKKRKTGA